ncbi:hypothetical protein [Haemophilus pittmaniae]|uniref:hypothetical protein n=1 Tax=Haemophilus pittmaniae TaxID=249188 RepID=UPI0028DD0BED|nr:hypothetical protein [Haemophilus pittmaniae]
MKYLKVLSIATLVTLAAACSQNDKPKQMEKKPSTSLVKNAVYNCGGKTLTVNYTFEGKTPISATAYLDNQRIAREMPFDDSYKSLPTFKLDNHRLTLDDGFGPETATTTDVVTLTEATKASDKILAKNCMINAEATAKANNQ